MAVAALFASPAAAVPQFIPNGNERLHTTGSGQPGAEWNTGGLLSGGELSYDSVSKRLTVAGDVDVLNWYDSTPASGCETDAGSNCSLNYSPNLTFVLEADLVPGTLGDISVAPIFGDIVEVTVAFATTGVTNDLIVIDGAEGMQLEAQVVAGTLNGDAIPGLIATILYNTATSTALFTQINGAGILNPTAGAHASLFGVGPDSFGLGISTISDFDDGLGGGLSDILAATLASPTNEIPDWSAEGAGEMFQITDGDFELPEPSTALMLLGSFTLLGLGRRRS